MPRYLARDYLCEYLREKLAKQEEILKLQLPNPGHLDTQSTYVHCGILPDETYRRPWKRVCYEKHQLQTGDKDENVQKWLESSTSLEGVEHFNRGCQSDLGEIVPSSNPESQDSFICGLEDSFGAEKKEINEITSETFTRLNIEKHCTTTETDLHVEEVLGTHDLGYLKRSLPPVRVIAQRLRPLSVQDPLSWDEEELFRTDRKYTLEEDETQQTEKALLQPESFTKLRIFDIECELLEEELVLREEEVSQGSCVSNCGHDIEESLRTLPEEKLDKDTDVFTKSLGLLANDLEPQNKPEILDPPPDKITCNFTEINNEGVTEDQILRSEQFCLESPSIPELTASKSLLPWKDLEQFSLEEKSCWNMLSQKKKEALENSFWMYQKFLDNKLIHRLREPDTTGALEDCITFKDVCKALDLNPLVCDELHLPWVPVDYGDVVSAAVNSVEPLDQTSCKNAESDSLLEAIQKEDLGKFKKEDDISLSALEPKVKSTAKVIQNQNTENPTRDQGEEGAICPTRTQMRTIDETLSPVQIVPLPASADPLERFLWMKQLKAKTHNYVNSVCEKQKTIPVPDEAERRTLPKERPTQRGDFKQTTPKTSGKETNQTRNVGAASVPSAQLSEFVDHNAFSTDIDTVQLTDDYKKPALLLWNGAKPLLQKLQVHGLLPANQSLAALTPAITRFILKQHEKSCDIAYEKEGQRNENYDDVYPVVVGLHALVDALHSLLHGCLPLAAVQMAEIQQKYGVLPHGLEEIRHKLLEMHFRFDQHHIRHPKILAICEKLSKWLKGCQDYKVIKAMVVVNRRSPHLAISIRDGLSMVEGLQPNIYPLQEEMTSKQVMRMLEKCKCLIVSASQVTNDFPMAQFSYVIEYEHTLKSTLKETCTQANISYLGLEIDTMSVLQKEETFDVTNSEENIPLEEKPEIILIGSDKVIADSELLHVLETKNNILVMERDYREVLRKKSQIGFADLILDESNCIVLQNIADLAELSSASPLVMRLARLSNKYKKCWLILHSPTTKNQSYQKYPYAGMVPSSLARLHAGIAHLSHVVADFDVKVLHSNNAAQTGDFVRKVAEMSWEGTEVWKKEEWLNRTWITPAMSKHEKFLLQIPYLNSFRD